MKIAGDVEGAEDIESKLNEVIQEKNDLWFLRFLSLLLDYNMDMNNAKQTNKNTKQS